MSSSAYSASEYDAFVVGEWRPVRSYCPRRHRWVVDYAAPIVAATVVPVDGDAQLQRERMPGDGKLNTRERIINWMGDGEYTSMEVAKGLGINPSLANKHLSDTLNFAVCREVPNPNPSSRKLRATIRVYRVTQATELPSHGTQSKYAELRAKREAILIKTIQQRGDLSSAEVMELLGVDHSMIRKIVENSDTLTRYPVGQSYYITIEGD